jgi:hypothetical protein
VRAPEERSAEHAKHALGLRRLRLQARRERRPQVRQSARPTDLPGSHSLAASTVKRGGSAEITAVAPGRAANTVAKSRSACDVRASMFRYQRSAQAMVAGTCGAPQPTTRWERRAASLRRPASRIAPGGPQRLRKVGCITIQPMGRSVHTTFGCDCARGSWSWTIDDVDKVAIELLPRSGSTFNDRPGYYDAKGCQ